MEIISQRTFDIFRYIFPGIFVVGIFIVLKESSIKTPDDVVNNLVDKIQSNQAIFLIGFSYIVGIGHDQFCTNILLYLREKFKIKDHYEIEFKSKNSLSPTEKYALLRHFSPKNSSQIDTWNMLKGMCINISGFLLYFSLTSFIKIVFGNPFLPWFTVAVLSLIVSYLTFIRSKIYKTWSIQDLDSTIDALNLEEKGKLFKNTVN